MGSKIAIVGLSLFVVGLVVGVLITLRWMRWSHVPLDQNGSTLLATPPSPRRKYEILMPIEDMFVIKGRGYVATGEVTAGPIRVGEQVWVSTAKRELFFRILAIETPSGTAEKAEPGEQIGVLSEGDGGDHLQRGHVLRRKD